MKVDYSNMIRMKLLREMKSGEFSECDKLPRELELAKQLNVSRNHLREVLAQLEREGFITRMHGVGTIINHHVMKVKNRMDIEVEFLDIIRQNGHLSYIRVEAFTLTLFVVFCHTNGLKSSYSYSIIRTTD